MRRKLRYLRHCLILAAALSGAMALPPVGPARAGDILPDGCLGRLSEDQVVVYYFHRKFRCQSCEVIESTLQSALTARYGDQFGTGQLAMCVINLDDPGNRHYLEQFQILSNAVVIVEKKKGAVFRFKNLDALWNVSQDRDTISSLLTTEVGSFLPGS